MEEITTFDVYGRPYKVKRELLAPSIHVYGIAVEDGKALIVPQYDGYDWPGGTFELGEDTIMTLKREVKEETGYDVEPMRLIDVQTSFFHHMKKRRDYQSLLIYYLVKITGGEISDEGFDAYEQEYAKEARWVPLGELRNQRLACNLDIGNRLLDLAEAQ